MHQKYSLFLIVALFILITENSSAQEQKPESKNKLSFAARGKAIGFFIIEDTYFLTYTFGGELIWNERHSLGLDYTWFRWRNEYDDSVDVAMYSKYQLRNYLLADYKFRIIKFKFGQLYFNAYGKSGQYRSWGGEPSSTFDFKGKDLSFLNSTSTGTYQQLGAGIGLKSYFDASNFGIDFSLNMAKTFTKIDEINWINKSDVEYNYGLKNQRNNFYIRVNFFYHFLRRKI